MECEILFKVIIITISIAAMILVVPELIVRLMVSIGKPKSKESE